ILDVAPEGLEKVFFTNAGTEAVEHATRMARLHTGRIKVLSAYRSYHGGTALSVNLTGDPRRWPNDYGSAGVAHFFGPFLYRSPFHSTSEEEETQRALEHLDAVISFEGPSTIAAVVLETIPGTAGIMPPPPGYLAGVRELCDRHGIVYVADEVMCGFGRTGAWFAVDHWKVAPDLIAFAKGVTSGYVPLGGVIISDEIAHSFDECVYPGGLTYSGHPLACAAAVATMSAMHEEGIVENAAMIGRNVIGSGLNELAERHPSVGEVRGLGVFWALDLVVDRATKEPAAPYGGSSPAMDDLVAACKERGLIPFTNFNRLHVVPPCTISESEAKEGIAILDEALKTVDAHYRGS
ncbi:MAG TPA: aminotransferase class III-fold pyridoxal phosphate-dependent enzyme, partial [Acidimicrobiales bacterium]|nr:aminotransferase class III-fold pyridoxal phosphate-dependent enzyme [Acidimicrobiales bacterium]